MSRQIISLVVIMRNCSDTVCSTLNTLHNAMSDICKDRIDHEIIVIDNGSTDGTADALRAAVTVVPQVKVKCLVSDGDPDAAVLAGMESSMGSVVILMDPSTDPAGTLGGLIEAVLGGADIAIAAPQQPSYSRGDLAYRMLSGIFVKAFRIMSGVHLRDNAPLYRAMTRDVVAYVTRHDTALQAHRALPFLGGFKTVTVANSGPPLAYSGAASTVRGGIDRALGILTATSTAPLRVATAMCALAAAFSLVYSLYVAATFLFRREVAPGWTTLSLQISFMFVLLSIAIGLLSEYVLHMASSSYRKPPYHVVADFKSDSKAREARLNVVGAQDAGAD